MKLSAEGKLRLAARLVFVVGVGVISADAFAADVAADVAEADEQGATSPSAGAGSATPASGSAVQLGGVQVTGSRIKSVNLTGNAPVTTVGSQELQFQGTTRVEDLLNSLPSVFADQGANISNGSDGTATVNLRNLGSARTLVLIDGKRVQPGSPLSGGAQADLNFIPAALIDRVEVLTGGASSVYGADAVAGVVNFIMKKDFEGIRIDYQRSGYQHDNGTTGNVISALQTRKYPYPTGSSFDGGGDIVTAVMGINSGDGKGNLTAYATFQHNDAVNQSQRDYSSCNLADNAAINNFVCFGSSNTGPGGRFFPASGGSYTVDPTTGNTFRPYVGARDAFNFAPYNYYLRNDQRYGLGANGHYKFNEMADAYTSLMFTDDRTDAVIAPSGAFIGPTYFVNCSDPQMSAQQQGILCGNAAGTNTTTGILLGRRNVEGGGRDAQFGHTAYRIVLGLKGDLSDAWSYDVSGQYGTTIQSQVYKNDFSVSRLQRALNVVAGPGGVPTCQSAIADANGNIADPNCVPYNIYTLGGVTPAALAYLQTPGFQTGRTEEQVVTGSLSGTLGKYGLISPFAKDGIGVALGSEYRREYLLTQTDVEFSTGDLAGQGGATKGISGGFNVREIFGEVRIPIVQDRFLAKDLSLEGGYRYSDYSSTASTDTYKLAGDWSPVGDVRFRGGYNRAVRAPNVGELAAPLNVALGGATDPCAGTTPMDSATQCARDPAIAANPGLYGHILESPAGQYNAQSGTSPGLKPETADTYTAGVVLQPHWVKNLSVTVDWFNIRVKDAIGSYGADNILSACYDRGAFCNLIHRDPATGQAQGALFTPNGYTIDNTTNTGALSVHGVDYAINYRLKLSQLGLSNRAGSLSFDFIGTRDLTEKHQIDPTNPSSYTCNGFFGLQCGTPVPNWRHKLRGTYTVPTYWLDSTVTASAQWRYIGDVRADSLSGPSLADSRLPSVSYMDLTASISFKSAYTFRVGVNNVFDRDPPLTGSANTLTGTTAPVFGNGNTYPQVYDALGRYAFAGVTLDF